jgi:hypothetical protein
LRDEHNLALINILKVITALGLQPKALDRFRKKGKPPEVGVHVCLRKC